MTRGRQIWRGPRLLSGGEHTTDYVLFSNYEALVDALLDAPDMAWIQRGFVAPSDVPGQMRQLAMRNTTRVHHPADRTNDTGSPDWRTCAENGWLSGVPTQPRPPSFPSTSLRRQASTENEGS